jgi:hypothetical protein
MYQQMLLYYFDAINNLPGKKNAHRKVDHSSYVSVAKTGPITAVTVS